jgi:predicted RNA methylase
VPSTKPATQAAKVKLGNTRVTGKEQFYTPSAVANQMALTVQKWIPDLAIRTVIEPAGGTGAFISAVEKLGVKNVLAFDIEPKHPLVKKLNFLDAQLLGSNAVTISNPPFGRNNSLSIPFFNHAADASEYIAFIVPKSWRKWSVINRLDRRMHLIYDEELTIDYVDENDQPLHDKKHLNTIFQIWQKRDQRRPIIRVSDMGLVSKVGAEQADVALTIFGYGCGRVRTEFERKPNSTTMFLKLNHPKALESLRSANFEKFYQNTAYTEALSLQEINYLLNEQILGDPHLEQLSD